MGHVGRYRLMHRLGQGGMAEVVAAVAVGEDGFERRVAIKRMLPGRDTGSVRRMFVDEARIASHLHHANIVGVLDFGIADDVPFQVLELVEGQDALALSCQGLELGYPLPHGLSLHICTEVAHALGHAHSARDTEGRALGIVHRDVKPTNILLSWDGDVKLTDFGVAFAWNRTERTSIGIAKGTRLYMSPEQSMGLPPDARSDLFSLGCTLHALITGSSPLEAPGALNEMLSGQSPTLDPALPADLRAVVERATRFRREERYEDAVAMAVDLGRLAAARLVGDARSALRDWLSRLRPEVPRARRGDLDGLLDVEMVLAGAADDESTDRDVRRFVTAPTKAERKHSPAPVLIGDEATAREEAEPPAPRRAPKSPAPSTLITRLPVRPRWPLFVVALLVVGLGTLAARWIGGRTQVAAAPTIATWTAPPSAPPAREPTAPTGPIDPGGALPEGAAVPPATREQDRTPRAPARTEASPPEAPAASAPAVPPARPPPLAAGIEIREGVLAVGGAGAQRAEVIVDGRSVGFAPKRLTVAIGAHTVELVQADGRRIGPHTVVVDSRHTQSAPARWIVP